MIIQDSCIYEIMEFRKENKGVQGNYHSGTESEKDLGLTIQNNITSEKHRKKITGEACNFVQTI